MDLNICMYIFLLKYRQTQIHTFKHTHTHVLIMHTQHSTPATRITVTRTQLIDQHENGWHYLLFNKPFLSNIYRHLYSATHSRTYFAAHSFHKDYVSLLKYK